MARRQKKRGGPTCLVCNNSGHEAHQCRSVLDKINQAKGNQHNSNQQKGNQQNKTKTCNHCNKPGHIRAECYILNPSLKNQRRGPQQPQGGKQCTHCQKMGHTVDECYKAHPELQRKGPHQPQGGKQCTHCQKKGHTVEECFKAHPELGAKNKQKDEVKCFYCLMPGHSVEDCYVLHPQHKNPYHDPHEQLTRKRVWTGPEDDKAPVPARLASRIKEAEALGRELVPEEINWHPKVRRIQGWYPAYQTYYTLPLYGTAIPRPVWKSDNPFAKPTYEVSYELHDSAGDTVMCSCECAEDHECELQMWVRKAVERDRPLRFSDEQADAFMRMMKDGLCPDEVCMIY